MERQLSDQFPEELIRNRLISSQRNQIKLTPCIRHIITHHSGQPTVPQIRLRKGQLALKTQEKKTYLIIDGAAWLGVTEPVS